MTPSTPPEQETPGGAGANGPGAQLQAARERAGISRESMAERLRLSLDRFEALERDDYATLPPPAYIRGYFRAYARELGLEADGFVAAYDARGGAEEPALRTGGGVDASGGGKGSLVGLLLIALVAAGGIGAWWYQQRMPEGLGVPDVTGSDVAGDEATGDADGVEAVSAGADEETASGGSANDGGEAAASGDGAAADTAGAESADGGTEGGDDDGGEVADAEVAVLDDPLPASPDAETASTEGDAAGDDDAAEPVTAETGSTEGAAADEPGATSPDSTDSPGQARTEAAATGPDSVTLEFDERSWVEVRDDRQRQLMYTLYYGNEPVTLRGWAPFEIFLGNSPPVRVLFNGETVDKSAFTRSNNTARFLVDQTGASSR